MTLLSGVPCLCVLAGYGLEVDMWAAGVILYILLCGFPPFRSPERDQDELFSIIQLGQFEFLAPYWDSISDGEIWGLPVRGRRATGLFLLFQRVARRGVWRVWVINCPHA